ncbi:MAG TPA: winged helix-turn-helix domain-containing protein [Blastocatellia bacterium]|nr:winged helix-turn-helix domain-containing protein [Blastocatellia bacterium]
MLLQDNHLYEFEPFLLDAGSRILLKDGATVRLTPKAFETLLVLVQHGLQVVDKEQLLREVWPDSFVEEGSLSRNIHELRKALGDDSSVPRYIETIPKRGYRFIAPTKRFLPQAGSGDIAPMEVDTTVIEKHTFARVISEEFDPTDLPAAGRPIASLTEAQPLALPAVTEHRTRTLRTVLVIGIVLAAAIAVFVYLRLARISATSPPRAKSTLVRLTNNNAMDSGPACSPDGSKIAFWSNREGKNKIYVMDADGSNVKQLTNLDGVDPVWSPDGRKILFGSERDGNPELYVMDEDGGNQTRLTRNLAADGATSWSPDGTRIAFASNRDNPNPYNWDIYVMDADGSNVKRIVDDLEYDAEPRWSPDGQKMLFVTGRNHSFDVYVMNPDGSDQRNLTADIDDPCGSGTWSRDGKSIAFVRTIKGKEQVYVMDADGGNIMAVTNNTARNENPSFFPDGSKLLFSSDHEGNLEVYVMSVDGELLQLTDDPADDINPAWSPDGNKIAFSSNRDGKHQIYAMNSDGSGLMRITHSTAADSEPSWSPDAKKIAYTSDRDGNKDIHVINADGTNDKSVAADPTNDMSPKWSLDGRILFNSYREGQSAVYVMSGDGTNVTRLIRMRGGQAAWSPDGSKLAFISPATEGYTGFFPLQVFVADSDGNNVRMLTKTGMSLFVPSWSSDGSTLAFVADNVTRNNIFQIGLDGRNFRRLSAGPKSDDRPAISPDGSKLAFQSNRAGNFEIYVMNLR